MIPKGTKLLDILPEDAKKQYLAEKAGKKIEQATALKICRAFARELKTLGFKKATDKNLYREKEHIIEFVSIHKYTFGPCFRLEPSIRVKNDPLEFLALTGICSDGASYEGCPSVYFHDIEYTENEDSFSICVKRMMQYINEVAEPWYKQWDDPINLIISDNSPLKVDEKSYLSNSIEGKGDPNAIAYSQKLFKIKVNTFE
jgi:hypothetical protein